MSLILHPPRTNGEFLVLCNNNHVLSNNGEHRVQGHHAPPSTLPVITFCSEITKISVVAVIYELLIAYLDIAILSPNTSLGSSQHGWLPLQAIGR